MVCSMLRVDEAFCIVSAESETEAQAFVLRTLSSRCGVLFQLTTIVLPKWARTKHPDSRVGFSLLSTDVYCAEWGVHPAAPEVSRVCVRGGPASVNTQETLLCSSLLCFMVLSKSKTTYLLWNKRWWEHPVLP